MMINILYYICIIIFAVFAIYWLARLQMKAWFHELDNQLGKKFVDKINKYKQEKDEKSKE